MNSSAPRLSQSAAISLLRSLTLSLYTDRLYDCLESYCGLLFAPGGCWCLGNVEHGWASWPERSPFYPSVTLLFLAIGLDLNFAQAKNVQLKMETASPVVMPSLRLLESYPDFLAKGL